MLFALEKRGRKRKNASYKKVKEKNPARVGTCFKQRSLGRKSGFCRTISQKPAIQQMREEEEDTQR